MLVAVNRIQANYEAVTGNLMYMVEVGDQTQGVWLGHNVTYCNKNI